MDKKIEVFKKVLTDKGINVKYNGHLRIINHVDNPCLYKFGENEIAICDENEYEDFIASLVLRNFDDYHFSFSTVAKIMKLDMDEIENYFLIYVLSNEDWIYKDNKENYFVTSEGVLKFIENKMSLEDFVTLSVRFFVSKEMINNLLDFRFLIVDGFYVFDLTDVSIIGSRDGIKV